MEIKDRPKKTTLREFCNAVKNEKTVFFIGSGVSLPYPSALPNAEEILNLTVNTASPPQAKNKEIKAIKDYSTPELYYEALVEFAGSEAAKIWSVLNLDQEKPELKDLNLGPELGHLAIIYLSWKHSNPVVTPNYDLRLEQAAKQLNLQLNVSDPTTEKYKRARHKDEVAIWKVRGSANDVSTIGTTLYDITKYDKNLMDKLRKLFSKYRPCLIGYSGRDFDLFPEIVEIEFPNEKAFWVDPALDPDKPGFDPDDHLAFKVSEKFDIVPFTSTSFAIKLIKGLSEGDTRITKLRKILKAAPYSSPENNKKEETAEALFKEHEKKYINELFEHIIPKTHPDRLIIHALSLASIGENKMALGLGGENKVNYIEEFLNSNPNPAKACRALVTKAYSLRELSRFADSRHAAEKAYNIAREHNLDYAKTYSKASIDSALYMEQLPSIGFREGRYLTRAKSWKTIIKMFFDCFSIRLPASHKLNEEGAIKIRARWNYLGHVARFCSIIQKPLQYLKKIPLLSSVVKTLLGWWWRYFEQKSKESGYSVGVSTARRYLDRLPNKYNKRKLPSSNLFGLIVGRTERALVAYNKAKKLIKQNEREKARQEFEEGRDKAVEVEDKMVALRGLIELKKEGLQLSSGEINDILEKEIKIDEIQCQALEEVKEELIEWLKRERICPGNPVPLYGLILTNSRASSGRISFR